jgi:hypothetical protein
MSKGIIMEVRNRECVVFTEFGAFVRVPSKGRTFSVGEEISLPTARRANPRMKYAAWSSAATAAVLIAVFLFSMLSSVAPPVNAQPVAFVSIDINPSVELGINEERRVTQAVGKNADAIELLDGLELSGLPLEEAVASVMEAAEKQVLQSRTEANIVITSVVVDETANIEEAALQLAVQSEVARVIEHYHAEDKEQFRVTVWSAPKEVLAEAEAAGLSVGKMMFYLKAKASGLEVTAEELQQSSMDEVAKRFKEKKLLSSDPAFTKKAIKELLKKSKKDKDRVKKQGEDDRQEEDDDTDTDEEASEDKEKKDKKAKNGKGKNRKETEDESEDDKNGKPGRKQQEDEDEGKDDEEDKDEFDMNKDVPSGAKEHGASKSKGTDVKGKNGKNEGKSRGLTPREAVSPVNQTDGPDDDDNTDQQGNEDHPDKEQEDGDDSEVREVLGEGQESREQEIHSIETSGPKKEGNGAASSSVSKVSKDAPESDKENKDD